MLRAKISQEKSSEKRGPGNTFLPSGEELENIAANLKAVIAGIMHAFIYISDKKLLF